MLHPELSKKCRQFILSYWGKDGLSQIKERPVTWVRYQANPQLQSLRRKRKQVPRIVIHGGVNRIHLELSTERHPHDPHR